MPDDVISIREVQKQGWLATYPNEKLGITKEDIEKKFNLSENEQKAYLEKRKKSINNNPEVTHTWIAKEGERVVGFCIADKSREHRIMAVYILPTLHRKGIGRALMNTMFNWLGKTQDIYVNCASYNDQALSFYESFGFRKTDSKPKSEVPDLPSGKHIPEIEMIWKV